MVNLKPAAQFDQRTLTFLEKNPAISQTLVNEFGENIHQVATLIGPILDAPNRCEISGHYIQAVATGRNAFLTTNVPDRDCTYVIGGTNSWLIGRSSNCAIAILDRGVSRCHAVIKYCPRKGFSVMDLGSSNGTFINQNRLTPLTPYYLHDGDLLEFGKFCIEFFISGWSSSRSSIQDTQF